METTVTDDRPVVEGLRAEDLQVEGLAVGGLPAERLEAEICTRAGQLAVMECEFLLLVAEFDRRKLYDQWEARSTAHWLTWKCALGSRAAHERVRVARRLEELPLITASFAKGELSYSKVRALTRVAKPRTEASLLGMATHATGAQVERLVSGRRKVDRLGAEAEAKRKGQPASTVRWTHDENGMVVINARLDPEAGDIVIKALEAAIRDERRGASSTTVDEAGKCSAEHSTDDSDQDDQDDQDNEDHEDHEDEKCSAEHSSHRGCDALDCPNRAKANAAADALVSMADGYLAHPDRIRSGADRYATCVLVEERGLDGSDPDGQCITDSGVALEPETARRLSCDSAIQPLIRRADGTILDAGHTTRVPNRATRRALRQRDGGCVFPGCGRTRWVDAHHIVHWTNHGPTRLDNLILLCRHHHRAVHEGGYTIQGNPQVAPVTFRRPDGSPVDPHCEHVDLDPADRSNWLSGTNAEAISPDTVGGNYVGDPLPLAYAVDCLVDQELGPENPDHKMAGGSPSG